MLELNYFIFPLYTLLVLLSILGYGYFFSNRFVKNFYLLDLKNLFFIQGLFFIGLVGALINLIFPLSNQLSLLILFLGLIFYFYYRKKSFNKNEFFFIFFIIFLSSFLSIHAGINDDFNYHLDTINNYKSKTLFEIEHSRRISYNSFWLFLHSITTFNLFTSTFYVLGSVLYSITIYDSFNLYKKSIKEKNYYIGICSFFVLVFLLGVINKYKEFGTDVPGFILSVYVLYILFYNSFDRKNEYTTEILFIILILAFVSFIIKITNTLIFLYLIIILFRVDYKKLNLTYLLLPFTIIFIWFFQNYNISGCLVWPEELSCFKNNELAIKEAYFIESFAKGDINTNINVNGFEWIKVWLNNHLGKMLEIYLTYLILLILPILYFYFKSKEKIFIFNIYNDNKIYLVLLSSGLFSNIIWFLIAPAYRFGLFYNLSIIILFLLPFWIRLIKKYTKFIIIYSQILIVVVSMYFFVENIFKYNWYNKRYDIWPPILNEEIIDRKNH